MSIESWVRRVILRGTNGNEMSVNSDGSLPVTIQGASSSGGALGVDVQQSEIIQPTDIQSRLQTTIQTHNAVSVGASGSSIAASFIDCDGYDKIAGTILNDGVFLNSLRLKWSNDGATFHGDELILPSTNDTKRPFETGTKARYVKLEVINGESAAAHTMSAWAYLKS